MGVWSAGILAETSNTSWPESAQSGKPKIGVGGWTLYASMMRSSRLAGLSLKRVPEMPQSKSSAESGSSHEMAPESKWGLRIALLGGRMRWRTEAASKARGASDWAASEAASSPVAVRCSRVPGAFVWYRRVRVAWGYIFGFSWRLLQFWTVIDSAQLHDKPSARIVSIQRWSLVLLVAGGALNYVDRATLSVANKLIQDDLGIPVAKMGLLLSAFLWAYAFAQLPVGGLIDRIWPA